MPGAELGPRIVIAGTHSGVGKTTVATGLIAALRHAGRRPAAAKIGPDFIDPGYHSVASGRAPRNLDAWLCGTDAIVPLAARASNDADLLIIEGVMGLFDGASDGTASSTADIARILNAPLVLVVDASAMSASVAAFVHGFATFDTSIRVAGVILNQVGSAGHEILLRESLEPLRIPILGALHRDDAMAWRDRHLGLVPVAERPADINDSLNRLAAKIAAQVDLDAVVALAATAPTTPTTEPLLPQLGPPIRIAVASGRAFTFTYTDTLDALSAAGAEIIHFDPTHDESLPEGIDGLLIGGGFPEVYAAELASNRRLLTDVRRAVTDTHLTTWAECGGLLLLSKNLDGRPMAAVVDSDATMGTSLTLGYRDVTTNVDSPLGPKGTTLRGHEFHYSLTEPGGEALSLTSRWGTKHEGWATSDLLATYVHHHPGGDPSVVGAFAERCALRAALRASHE